MTSMYMVKLKNSLLLFCGETNVYEMLLLPIKKISSRWQCTYIFLHQLNCMVCVVVGQSRPIRIHLGLSDLFGLIGNLSCSTLSISPGIQSN